jgi:hypothetical protein
MASNHASHQHTCLSLLGLAMPHSARKFRGLPKGLLIPAVNAQNDILAAPPAQGGPYIELLPDKDEPKEEEEEQEKEEPHLSRSCRFRQIQQQKG